MVEGGNGAANTGTTRVLLVDDDEHILDFLGLALRDEGYTVTTARHGAEALDVLRREPPHVIILDLWMPVMDGEQFLREYRALPGPHAAVIALTAAQYDPNRSAGVEADDFLTKPFSLDSLIGLVGRHAGQANSQ